MLPDFLEFKVKQAREFATTISAGDGLVHQIRRVAIQEGEGFVTIRADGTQDRKEMIRVHESTAVPTDVIRAGDMAAVGSLVGDLKRKVSERQTKILLDNVTEAVDSVGNSVSAGGKPLTAELLLDALRKMEFQFDAQGNWEMPTLVTGPALASSLEKELRRLFEDPVLSAEVKVLVERGRKRWSDRESNRKLVD
jgi:hypothetical protein